ncbi:unnamed protein product, partial [marine sediment metagenome]
YNFSVADIKKNFDKLLYECEAEAYNIYLASEWLFLAPSWM